MAKKEYDRKRSIYSHKKGKALKFGEAWLDHVIEYGCDPVFKDLYMKIVAKDGTIDKDDITDDMVLDEDLKIINATTSAYTFIKRYAIREWVNERKLKELFERTSMVKDDYVGMLNAIILNPKTSEGAVLKAIQQVTKMLGCEGASRIEQTGGLEFSFDIDLPKKEDIEE